MKNNMLVIVSISLTVMSFPSFSAETIKLDLNRCTFGSNSVPFSKFSYHKYKNPKSENYDERGEVGRLLSNIINNEIGSKYNKSAWGDTFFRWDDRGIGYQIAVKNYRANSLISFVLDEKYIKSTPKINNHTSLADVLRIFNSNMSDLSAEESHDVLPVTLCGYKGEVIIPINKNDPKRINIYLK